MTIEVATTDLTKTRVVEDPPVSLGEGQARIAVETFGFSANNVTYAVMGDLMGYWQFFPAADDATGPRWGRVPVWGFGVVTESRSDDLAVGERLFGYFPMGPELVITVGRPAERTVADVSPHRASLPSPYNSFQRCATDPVYRTDREDLQMLLFPLFFTSFVIDDFLEDNHDFGANQIIISSASSKTAIGEAFLAHSRGARVIGLTSATNKSFVESLDCYDGVLTYDEVASLALEPSVYVDVAGNRDVQHAVHHHFGDLLAHSMLVGVSHWDHETAADLTAPLPGPKPEFLFAPTQIAKRTEDWGTDGLNERVSASWTRFCDWIGTWLELSRARGIDGVVEVYSEVLGGAVDPKVGFICSWE